jgi:hypothetical protein
VINKFATKVGFLSAGADFDFDDIDQLGLTDPYAMTQTDIDACTREFQIAN